MSKYILAIDQSTTNTKAIIFNHSAEVVARSDIGHKQITQKAGWLEHDPEEIWKNLVEAVKTVIEKAGISKEDISFVAVTNQRETVMLWDENGKPVNNAVVWQCARAEYIVERPEIQAEAQYITEATGLQLSPYFSAAKAAWIKENSDIAGKKLFFGNMDSWVVYKLTGNHCTDASNASRTQLFNIHTLKWDEKLLKAFHLDDVNMPEVKDADDVYGYTTVGGVFDTPIPVAGVMGDSHGALFAQMCWKPGTGKCTFGTGGSLMVNIGETPTPSTNRLNTSIAWKLSGKVDYVYEGTIIFMGDTLSWLKNELNLIQSSSQSEEFAEKVDSTEGVYLIPAFTGLGSPYWDNSVRGLICGLNRYSNKYHVVRAALEAISYQMRDIIDPMMQDANAVMEELRVDGGPTNNRFLMQFTADILNTKIVKNSVEELSALGAAFAGGLATGYFKDMDEIATYRRISAEYSRKMNEEEAEKLYKGWKQYVRMLLNPGKE